MSVCPGHSLAAVLRCPSGRRVKSDPSDARLGSWTAAASGSSGGTAVVALPSSPAVGFLGQPPAQVSAIYIRRVHMGPGLPLRRVGRNTSPSTARRQLLAAVEAALDK